MDRERNEEGQFTGSVTDKQNLVIIRIVTPKRAIVIEKDLGYERDMKRLVNVTGTQKVPVGSQDRRSCECCHLLVLRRFFKINVIALTE